MYKQSIYNMFIENDADTYIYNSLSGELAKINANTAEYLQHIETNAFAQENVFFEHLLNKGFIVDSQLDEYARYIALMNEQMYSSQSEYVSYVIALTTHCNYKCVYCYEDGCKAGTIDEKTANKIAEFIISEAERNKNLLGINITWFGGEPLLAIEKIRYIGENILGYCRRKSLTFLTNIITNGSLLTDENLIALNRFNLQNIQVTFDGTKEQYYLLKRPATPDSFEKVLHNIGHASQTNRITIRLNCSRNNYQSIKELCKEIIKNPEIKSENIQFSIAKINKPAWEEELTIDEFANLKLDFISFLNDIGLPSQIKPYLPAPRLIPCGLMKRTNFVIDHEGFLYKCEHYVGQKDASVGNVFSGLLYPAFQTEFEKMPFKSDCQSCPIFPVCRAGCSQKRFVGLSSVSCSRKVEEITYILKMIIKNNG